MPLVIKSRANENEKHDLDITTLIFHKDKLYSASDDGKIKVWDEDLKLLDVIEAHPCSVFSITIGNNNLYSCSNDGFVKAWSLDNFKEEEVVVQDKNEIYKVNFNEGKLYIGDDAGLVRIFVNNTLVGILEIMHPIADLLAIGNLIYTARDLYVIISEIHPEGKRMETLKAIEGRSPICVIDDKLCFPSRSAKDIVVHNNSKATEFKKIAEVKGAHDMIINALCGLSVGNELFLYSGGWDKTLKKWKIESEMKLVDSCDIDVCITSITVGSKGQLFIGGADGHIFCVDGVCSKTSNKEI